MRSPNSSGCFLAQMVDEQDGDAVSICDPFQRREVAVVVGIGVVVVGAADHLQRVDDDQHRAGMFSEEGTELFLQTLAGASSVISNSRFWMRRVESSRQR